MRATAPKKKIIGSGTSALTPSASKRIKEALSATRIATSSSKEVTTVVAENDDDGLPLGTPRSGEKFVVGERVFLHGLKKWGFVRYFGNTWFSDGKWVGIELMEESGRNDGTVQGRRYFSCKPKYGVFVRPSNCSTSGDATPALRRPSRENSSSSINPPLPPRVVRTAPAATEIYSNQVSSLEDKVAALSQELVKVSLLASQHTVLCNRMQSLECSLGAITEKTEQARYILGGIVGRDIAAPRHSESSTQDDTQKSPISTSDEVEALKSTLAMVAALARQAQDATLQERMENTEKIRALEAKLSVCEGR